ncbi:MAG: hypothetical protein JO321_14365 [Solirubrobacterales bacterium]|nr:hypothetical protein [Solirubrobacterales bacterium]
MLVAAAALGVALALLASGPSRPPTASLHARATTRPARTGPVARGSRQPTPSGDIADLPRLVGQLAVGRYAGPQPSADFLARVRAGQLGAVILFSDNMTGGLHATRQAIAELQEAARQGGNPPLLIMTDQEGGEVRRLSGPPQLAPAQMDSPAVARSQGAAAGRLLRSVGINVDLAPVADVERVPGSFLGSRAFGSDPELVATRACAFAAGLQSAGVAYTLKHFPGLGRAIASTDESPVTITARDADLRADYAAYHRCGSSPDALVMVSSAIYPGLSGSKPAVMSPRIYAHELPLAVGRGGHLTISDALDTPALAGERTPAVFAIRAGLDLALFPGNEVESARGYAELLAATRTGALPPGRVWDAVYAVEALKRRVAK